MHILLINNDPLLRHSLAFNLMQSKYRTSVAAKLEDALSMVQADRPDLILLDVDLTDTDTLRLLRWFTAQVDLPIVFLVARSEDLDTILGADGRTYNYMIKPFDLDVLLARIKAILRPVQPTNPAPEISVRPVVVGDLTIDPVSRTVTIGDQSLELPPREFALLHTLAHNAGQVLSIEQLLATVWGITYAGDAQVVYVHIRWLREKLEVDPYTPRRIITVRGAGYKLLAQV